MRDRFAYFDLGNVLVHFDHQIAVDQLAARSNRPAEQVRSIVFEADLQDRYETGLISSVEYASQINDALQSQLPASEILEAISAIFEPNPSILDAFSRFKDANVPMGVLSNTCEAHWEWILQRGWPMPGDWFDFHVLSYEVRSMKPNAGIYEHCEKRAQCSPEKIFFTDDRADNIAAAAMRGWHTHQYQTTEGLLQAIDQWLAT